MWGPRWIALGVLAAGGCGDAPGEPVAERPLLHIDVGVSQHGISVSAVEADQPDLCNQVPFIHPGTCDVPNDLWACSPRTPAEWLRFVRLERDGAVVAENPYDAPFGGGIWQVDTGPPRGTLVLVDDLGDEVRIPLPDLAAPIPTIDDVIDTDDGTEVVWSSAPPAASAVVTIGRALSGDRCHVHAGESARLGSRLTEHASLAVEAFAAPIAVTTAFGDVHVWIGNLVVADAE